MDRKEPLKFDITIEPYDRADVHSIVAFYMTFARLWDTQMISVGDYTNINNPCKPRLRIYTR